jgi:hypothetical protein
VACSAELTHGFSDTGSGIAVAGVAQHAVHLGAEVGNVDLFFTVRGVHGHHNLSRAQRRKATGVALALCGGGDDRGAQGSWREDGANFFGMFVSGVSQMDHSLEMKGLRKQVGESDGVNGIA